MKAVLWSGYNCTYCDQAKQFLKTKNIAFEERKIGDGWTKEEFFDAVPGARTVPQIFLDDQYVGGLAELKKLLT
jgi:glutaredoxin 3